MSSSSSANINELLAQRAAASVHRDMMGSDSDAKSPTDSSGAFEVVQEQTSVMESSGGRGSR